MSIKKQLWALPVIAFAAGCVSPEPQLATGNSVRQMIAAQTADPAAAERNGTQATEGTDPVRADNAIRAMREGVSKPAAQEGGVTVNIGGGSGIR
jgi:hypothetical protein